MTPRYHMEAKVVWSIMLQHIPRQPATEKLGEEFILYITIHFGVKSPCSASAIVSPRLSKERGISINISRC